jgi:hypothetical protein
MLKTQLQQWCKLNEFDTRTFKIFRNPIKFGDQVFVRENEPEPEEGMSDMEVAGPVGQAGGMAGNTPGGAPGQI